MKGSTAAEFKEKGEVKEQALVFSAATATETKTQLLFGASNATAIGTLLTKLTGANKEKIWGPVRSLVCKAKPTETEGTLVCPKGEAFSGKFEAELEEAEEAIFESSSGNVFCTEVLIQGELKQTGSGSITTETFHSGGGGPCTSTLSEKPTVKVEVKEMPLEFTTSFTQVGAPQGQMQPPAQMRANMTIGGQTCIYRVQAPGWSWTNGPPPGWAYQQVYELENGMVPPLSGDGHAQPGVHTGHAAGGSPRRASLPGSQVAPAHVAGARGTPRRRPRARRLVRA